MYVLAPMESRSLASPNTCVNALTPPFKLKIYVVATLKLEPLYLNRITVEKVI